MYLEIYLKGNVTDILYSEIQTDQYTSLEEMLLDAEVDELDVNVKIPSNVDVQNKIPSFCYTKDLIVTDYLFDWLNLSEEEQEIVFVYNRYVDNYCNDVEEILEKYSGTWYSERDFTEEFINDIYSQEITSLPSILQYAIDYDLIARDLFLTDFIYVSEYNMVFRSY
mgnify:CR=1 FL=1